MSNQYLIQKETLDNIAVQSMSLAGKTDAVSTADIISDLTSVNSEVGTQADLIEQIKTALENKASGDSPSVSEPVLQSKTVTPSANQQEIVPDDGYDGLDKVVLNGDEDLVANNIKKGVNIFGVDGSYEVQQATPTIAVNSDGLITATAGDKNATKQLTTQSTKTWTPTTSDQTIDSGTYITGTQTIKGDSNLKAENIKSGISIFGVSGSLSSYDNIGVTEYLHYENNSVLDDCIWYDSSNDVLMINPSNNSNINAIGIDNLSCFLIRHAEAGESARVTILPSEDDGTYHIMYVKYSGTTTVGVGNPTDMQYGTIEGVYDTSSKTIKLAGDRLAIIWEDFKTLNRSWSYEARITLRLG